MKLNPECIRCVLKYCVENIDYKEIGLGDWTCRCVSLDELYKSKELKKYDKKDIMYSVLKLHEYNYIIITNVSPKNKTYFDKCSISDVTIHGHNFYESIREDTIWNKTKNVIGKVGNHTLHFIEDTAQMIAVESAKQAVTIMMTGHS